LKKITIKSFNLKTMNYSTLKKSVALSFASLMAAGMVSAQTTTTTTTTTDSTKVSSATTAKVFGGRGQYRTFSIGINGGVTSPVVALGGSNDFTKHQVSYGYGLSLRSQLAHSFGLQLDARGGRLKGNMDNAPAVGGVRAGVAAFQTDFYQATLSGVVNVATIDFLRRQNSVNFFVNSWCWFSILQPRYCYYCRWYNY
jgi:OOP family OmpA-OmpF porin